MSFSNCGSSNTSGINVNIKNIPAISNSITLSTSVITPTNLTAVPFNVGFLYNISASIQLSTTLTDLRIVFSTDRQIYQLYPTLPSTINGNETYTTLNFYYRAIVPDVLNVKCIMTTPTGVSNMLILNLICTELGTFKESSF